MIGELGPEKKTIGLELGRILQRPSSVSSDNLAAESRQMSEPPITFPSLVVNSE